MSMFSSIDADCHNEELKGIVKRLKKKLAAAGVDLKAPAMAEVKAIIDEMAEGPFSE